MSEQGQVETRTCCGPKVGMQTTGVKRTGDGVLYMYDMNV